MAGQVVQVAEALAQGRAAFPGVRVDDQLFAAHALRHAQPGKPLAHGADLFLAFACAGGDRAALRALEERHLSQVPDFVARIDSSAAFGDEVRQALRERLLVAQGSGRPRIAEYTGSGPLGGWVRVAALRTALNLKNKGGQARKTSDAELADRAVGSGSDPEMEVIRARSRKQFEAALKDALAALTVDERNVLRLHLIDRLSIDKIAALHRVHRATAARWLSSARAAILEGTKDRLRERLKLTASEFDSMAELVRSQLDVSLRSQLKSRT